jgi:hypothetical protein
MEGYLPQSKFVARNTLPLEQRIIVNEEAIRKLQDTLHLAGVTVIGGGGSLRSDDFTFMMGLGDG